MTPRAHGRDLRSERGTALVLALLVAFIFSLLGISFLWMTETDNRIARNEKHGALVLATAEAGTQAVKRWFDRPGDFVQFPTPAIVDRTLRRVLDESDPYGGAPQPADGAAVPYYKQDVDRSADGSDDLFHAPYRGDLRDALMGTEDGPDLRIDDAAEPARSFLSDLTRTLLGPSADLPGDLHLRIARVDVSAPPYLPVGAGFGRFGLGSVRVIARLYHGGDERSDRRVHAEREVRVVLSEVPYAGPYGPLHACGDLRSGVAFNHGFLGLWGPVTGQGLANFASAFWIPHSLPRAVPAGPRLNALSPTDPAEFAAFVGSQAPYATSGLAGTNVTDPWVHLLSGGPLASAGSGVPQPFLTNPLNGVDRSHVVQNWPLVICPQYGYERWKSLATSGGGDMRYFAYVGGGRFREDGSGPPVDFADATRDGEGVFFFDTADGLAPQDTDGDGDFDNLTPAIVVSGFPWSVRGFVYLNAESFKVAGAAGAPTPLQAPGEPFLDVDTDGVFDAGEPYVNLEYPAAASAPFRVRAGDTGTTGVIMRDDRGPATQPVAINMNGILYTSGVFEACGEANHYGSIVAASGVVNRDDPVGEPHIYWDESIAGDWPPPTWHMPRVIVTRWATDR